MKFKYIFYFTFVLCIFYFCSNNAYADTVYHGSCSNSFYERSMIFDFTVRGSDRVALLYENNEPVKLLCLYGVVGNCAVTSTYMGSTSYYTQPFGISQGYGFYKSYHGPTGNYSIQAFSFNPFDNLKYWTSFTSDFPKFSDFDAAAYYIVTGEMGSLPFDESLELDYFKVSTYEETFNNYVWNNVFKVGWSDSRIAQVQVIISGTRQKDSFQSSSSPYKQSFSGNTYANVNGDVITLIATPYKADGSYGVSLYYSFVYNANNPLSNVWRKNHIYNFQDNTIQIPYTGVSGNDLVVDVPVDGITQNTCYKVYYNPTTEEITNEYVYNVYYSPVIVYPENTSSEVIEEIQDTVINNYTTNNYYTTTNQINYSFNIDFNDISANDVQQTYDDVGGFFNGLGSFISKLVSIFQLLFPFLPSGLAAFIIIAFGIIALFVVVALAIKITGVITNLLP